MLFGKPLSCLVLGLAAAGTLAGTSAAQRYGSSSPKGHRFVAYLPYYKHGDMLSALQQINLAGVTDLDIAFVGPPPCEGVCTAISDNTISAENHTDTETDTIVRYAHAKGIHVMASIGGGGSGPSSIAQFYNAGQSARLITALDTYVRAHHFDGIDVDVESPDSMGAPYADFVHRLAIALHAEGKLITCATAKYIQNSVPDAAMREFDYINLMVYSNLKDAQDMLNFYVNVKHVPAQNLVLGVGFHGEAHNNISADYADILTAYPNAWKVDTVGGGTLKDGVVLNYTGEDTMARETKLSNQYGGIMIWQILADAAAPHSLMDIIRANIQ
jgi:chitinase